MPGLNRTDEYRVGILSKLTNATRQHLADEAAMMKAVKYPGVAMHIANYQRLLEKLIAFAGRFGQGGIALNQHAVNFLRDWLFHHVQNDDRRFGDWQKECAST
jgi:hemerythrin